MTVIVEQALGFMVRDAAGISAVVAVCVFAKSIYEYTLQNKLKRFEKYQDIAGQWDENKDLQKIRQLLEFEDKEKLAKAAANTKENFIHCYEDIAVMYESGLLSERMAFYMFGYYAIRSYQSKEFWNGLDKSDVYFTLFCRFAARMEVIEKRIRDKLDDPQRWKFKF
jgi:hypothetical protein